jgi:hypothetical protein
VTTQWADLADKIPVAVVVDLVGLIMQLELAQAAQAL